MTDYHLRAGSTAAEPFSLSITPQTAGWTESSLRILDLAAGDSQALSTDEDEVMIVPLTGPAVVESEDVTFSLVGRRSVFDGPTDFAYVGIDSDYTISSELGGRFALCGARAHSRKPFRYVPAGDVAVELRGAGSCSRQIHNFGSADTFDAESLIACEVLTPGGNWSSYPSHKHDEETEHESALEEIYYFEIAGDAAGFGYHRVYGTADRPIDVLAEVRTGDAVLVPHGYHGPSVAAPGYDMYYLNVMAGPGADRAWKIVDDPALTWIRDTWKDQTIDARLPFQKRGV
ncbi:5-deoxy-glucuronate isomerase [Antrihabitans cavernicola]|uniref:5-deoxy-glucuronate isomerase n=1 Tax=Antrihabitans cavernicola TaxID=2495913 RepID=A0A5A7SHD9_9NOCA|nr:5-deoxy-glucuronate isomerase [Spelaeibacter cavernicola]KAA0024137.1 5-deoxy-glucuronate isomerase [Spelaeibacter cavernicola]